MIPYDGLTPDVFARSVATVLSAPDGQLVSRADVLLTRLAPAQVAAFIDKRLGEKPSVVKHLAALVAIPMGAKSTGPAAWLDILPSARTSALVAATINHVHANSTYRRRQGALNGLIQGFDLTRPAIGLYNRERGVAHAMAALFANGKISAQVWDQFAAQLIWADGAAELTPGPALRHHVHLAEARQLLGDLLKLALPPHKTFLADTAARIAADETACSAEVRRLLSPGARWLDATDAASGGVLTTKPSRAALLIGHDPASGAPLYFDRAESLFTIGGPGTGKTECQVIPNLLSYPGSAIVLDVKGELFEKTAGYRQRHFGPVYRFAPTDPDGRSHRYNPFDFIATEAQQAATDCEVFSAQIVVPTANHNDPYWENRGRDFLWAMAMIVALRSQGRSRAMATLMRLLSVPLDVKASAPDFAGSDTDKLITGLDQLAKATGVPALAEHANAIRGGLGSQRLESVVDNARRFLNIFSRSATLRAAMSASDWHPKQLRERPGTTVYLCLSGDDLETFAPVVRLILQQHANALLRQFTHKPGEPPITFFLDEFPQLRRMDSILRMVDTGRGAGLRMWFFAQYLGQVRQAYDRQADGLIGSCRVRSFLSPDAEAAEFLKPHLGTSVNLFSGEKTPLAEPHDLLGAAFADKIVTLAGGPYQLAKRYAWQTMRNRILPPPLVPRLTLTP